MINKTHWIDWAREIFSISQSGLTYCKNEFDLARYQRLQEITAEMIADQSGMEKVSVLESFSMQKGYATPKIDVRGAVILGGKILLVQERIDEHWAMPGGWADLGDSPSAMVEREVREESGLIVHADKVIAVLDANRVQPFEFYHSYKIIFMCSYVSGETRSSNETLDAKFFDPDQLPPLSRFRTNEAMIREVFEHHIDPNRKTKFD